jgi:hypothetical protein
VIVGTDDDALAVLGLPSDASADDIRAARRNLAKSHHPDLGGDAEEMQAVNGAADAALQRLARPSGDVGPEAPTASPPNPSPRSSPGSSPGSSAGSWPGSSGVDRDVPSFTVEALPVETFEGLLVVATWIGEVLDDDPPYRLDVHLYEPVECWCRLDVVPDAGSSTVSLTIATVDGAPLPDIVAVRDVWISGLNTLDWD